MNGAKTSAETTIDITNLVESDMLEYGSKYSNSVFPIVLFIIKNNGTKIIKHPFSFIKALNPVSLFIYERFVGKLCLILTTQALR